MIDLVKFTTQQASGGDGVATAIGYSPPVFGRVLSVNVQYNDSPPASADINLSDEGDPAQESIITRTNCNADFRCYPRRTMQTNANADLSYDGTRKVCEPYVVHGRLLGSLSHVNDGDSVTFMVWMER